MGRNYNDDLRRMFEEIDAMSKEVLLKSKSIYEEHGLSFNGSAFRSVVGDIHAKVLGKYIRSVLNVEVAYEVPIVGKMRADIQVGEIITIEVKSHGLFSSDNLNKRFVKIVDEKPLMTHLYVAFRERRDYVNKTRDLLNLPRIETFFLSIYLSDKHPEIEYFPTDLQRLLEIIRNMLDRAR